MVEGTDRLDAKVEAAAERRMAGELVDLTGFTRAERDVLALRQLWEEVGDIVRSRTLRAERDAEKRTQPSEDPPVEPHGSAAMAHGGCSCDPCARYRSVQEEYDREAAEAEARHRARLQKAFDDYAAELRIEWTRELLDSPFALSDGVLVTWGDATVEQHRERVEMFERNAVANIEGAARHRSALRDLDQSGAHSLREMVSARPLVTSV